ncbi:MAG: hypothetical protein JXB35_03040 [Anaerolineae bacterium]|nr:hypothetical protein [Anaerolineae bacterium]
MDIEFLIERLEDFLVKESPKIPLSGNRAVNEEAARTHLAQLRTAIPDEIARAQQLLQQRDAVIAQAHQEAARIIADAEEEAQRLAGEHRVVQEARQQAILIRQRAREESEELRTDADEYVFNALSQLQEELARLQRTVDNGLQRLEADRERRIQERV